MEFKRIKELMLIKEEEQRPVTAPVNIRSLVLLLQHVHKIEPEWIESVEEYNDVDFSESRYYRNELGVSIEKNARLFALPNKFDMDDLDFISAFILENKQKILDGSTEVSEYIIPKLKTFLVIGEERYTTRKGDVFELKNSAYNEKYLENLIETGQITLSDGKFVREDYGDTWDMEQEILEIKEVEPNQENKSVNEQVDLDNYQAPFTAEDFTNYVNSEFDLEMLGLMQGIIQKRMNFLKRMVDMGKRTEVTGFKRFDK